MVSVGSHLARWALWPWPYGPVGFWAVAVSTWLCASGCLSAAMGLLPPVHVRSYRAPYPLLYACFLLALSDIQSPSWGPTRREVIDCCPLTTYGQYGDVSNDIELARPQGHPLTLGNVSIVIALSFFLFFSFFFESTLTANALKHVGNWLVDYV